MSRIGWGKIVWLVAALWWAGLGDCWAQKKKLELKWSPDLVLVHPMGAYPRVTELRDGILLTGFNHRVAGMNAIGLVRSRNGGETWGEYLEVTRGSNDLANAFPLQLADGTILMAFRNNSPGRKEYRLEVWASGDRGKTWKPHGLIATGSVGLWEPFLMEMPDRSLQTYYASEEGIFPDQRIEMRESRDGGRSWSAARTVTRKSGSRDGMPALAQMGKGRLLMVFEASDLRPYRFVIRAVRSRDNGKHWSDSRELIYQPENAETGRWAAGAPSVALLGDGRLVASFQSDELVMLKEGDWRRDPGHPRYDYLRRSVFRCITSTDQGDNWSKPMTLAGTPEEPALWNALYVTRAGKVLGVASYRGKLWCRRGSLQP